MSKIKNSSVMAGQGKLMPPISCHVQIYFDQKGSNQDGADAFFQFYTGNKWTTVTGCKVRDWKAVANKWIWDNKR